MRLAYTIDGYQPVKCSLVGDDPLYYCDDPQVSEEVERIFSPMMFEREPIRFEMPEYKELDVTELLFRLSQSNYLRGMLGDIAVVTSPHVKTAESRGRVITLWSYLCVEEAFLLCAKEIRRVWRGRYDLSQLSVDGRLFEARLHEADLAGGMVRAAWEAKLSGYDAPWRRLFEHDLKRAMMHEAQKDWRTLRTGQAQLHAVEGWYLSNRLIEVDKATVKTLLATFQDKWGDKHKPVDMVIQYTRLPTGESYMAKGIEIFLTDPVFDAIRDKQTANFAWFIKFESSFRS